MKRLLCMLVISTLFTACSKSKQQQPKGRPPAPVLTAVAVIKTVPVVVEAVGNVEAITQVAVKAMVSGEVKKVHFNEGKDVAKGDILFTIDARPMEASIKKAEADLARIRAQLATAKANADRYGKLVKDGIVTAEQYDTYRTQADSLEADLVAQQANIDALRVQLSYCTIRSPISGRTGNLLISAGNVVKANDTLPLVIINQIRPIYVSFSIPEKELSRIRQHLGRSRMRLQAVLPGDNGKLEAGEVTFLDNAVDSATATIKLKGTFSNPRTRLWPGQFATVRLTLASVDSAVVVPAQAVQTGQQGQYVFVVSGDTAEMRPVKVGVTYEGITVIEQGVKTGEIVVIDGHMRIIPGGKVAVKHEDGKGEQGAANRAKPANPAAAAGSTKP